MEEDFDICECITPMELRMRRLLSWIRQSQSHCTDTECVDLPSMPSQTQVGNENNSIMLMGFLLIFGVILFLFRPPSLRGRGNRYLDKPSGGPSGGSGDGSPPPAVN